MLTLVNRNPELKLAVIKSHHDGRTLEYQVHNEKTPLEPVVARFTSKQEADSYIKNAPVAPVIETRAMKAYSAPVHVRTGTGSNK